MILRCKQCHSWSSSRRHAGRDIDPAVDWRWHWSTGYDAPRTAEQVVLVDLVCGQVPGIRLAHRVLSRWQARVTRNPRKNMAIARPAPVPADPEKRQNPRSGFSCRIRSTTARWSDRGATRRPMSHIVSPAPTSTTTVFAGTRGCAPCPIQPTPPTTANVTVAAATRRAPRPVRPAGERTVSAGPTAEASARLRAEDADLWSSAEGSKGSMGAEAPKVVR